MFRKSDVLMKLNESKSRNIPHVEEGKISLKNATISLMCLYCQTKEANIEGH